MNQVIKIQLSKPDYTLHKIKYINNIDYKHKYFTVFPRTNLIKRS